MRVKHLSEFVVVVNRERHFIPLGIQGGPTRLCFLGVTFLFLIRHR